MATGHVWKAAECTLCGTKGMAQAVVVYHAPQLYGTCSRAGVLPVLYRVNSSFMKTNTAQRVN